MWALVSAHPLEKFLKDALSVYSLSYLLAQRKKHLFG